MLLQSWISPKTVKGKPSNIHGKGFFAKEDIKRGELVALKLGHIIDVATLRKKARVINHSETQIAEGLYLAPLSKREMKRSMIYFNHSCDPSCVLQGQIALVARQDVEAGGELTLDYATYFANNDVLIADCKCGAKSCRRVIKASDWKKPELQKRYGNNFAWFILKKIKNL